MPGHCLGATVRYLIRGPARDVPSDPAAGVAIGGRRAPSSGHGGSGIAFGIAAAAELGRQTAVDRVG